MLDRTKRIDNPTVPDRLRQADDLRSRTYAPSRRHCCSRQWDQGSVYQWEDNGCSHVSSGGGDRRRESERGMMDSHQQLFDDALLLSLWADEYKDFKKSSLAKDVKSSIQKWVAKDFQKETQARGAFVDVFFKQTWGYVASGQDEKAKGFSLHSEFPIPGAGASGGTGAADLALGVFGRREVGIAQTPQVLCEFKDVRSGLDVRQLRKNNNRSPVHQCGDYLRFANEPVHPSASIRPTWGIVTDMNEFRLYFRPTMPQQYQRFFLKAPDSDQQPDAVAVTDDTPEAEFQLFVFWKLFQHDMLLSEAGPSALETLLADQFIHEKEIERAFYSEYRRFRETVFRALVQHNPDFAGTKGKLVQLAQRFLDRCIFILYCEDMGVAFDFPPNILRDLLIEESKYKYYAPNDDQV